MNRMEKNCLMLFGSILLIFSFSTGNAIAKDNSIIEDIPPYDGGIGPGNPLYGLKIVIENMGEIFTFNESTKLEIELEHARNRIAEAKSELRKRNDDAANIAMDNFIEKIQAVDDRITGMDRNNKGLLMAQNETVKHRFVLEHLLEDHPNSTGLRRAFNNSLRLEDKFESKTDRSVVPVVSRDGVVLRQTRRGDFRDLRREVVQVEAKIVGNDTVVKVKVEFVSTSTDRDEIAQTILDKFQMNNSEIDNVLEIQAVDFEELNEILEAKATAGRNISEAEAEFRFPLLRTTNRTDIINGIAQKLSSLTKDKIMQALDFRVDDRKEIRKFDQNEVVEVRAKIIGNATRARVKVVFVSNKTDNNAISQEILNMLSLSRTNIDYLLEVEVSQGEDLKERQEARVIEGKITDIRREDRKEPEAERGGVGEVQIGDLRREDRGVSVSGIDLKETEPGDDRGREVEPRDDRGREVEPGDDRGLVAETGDVSREDQSNDRGEDRRDSHSEIGIGNNFSEVEFELEFILNTTSRSEIVDGIFQKLSTLTVQDVMNSVEESRLEIKQQIEDRR